MRLGRYPGQSLAVLYLVVLGSGQQTGLVRFRSFRTLLEAPRSWSPCCSHFVGSRNEARSSRFYSAHSLYNFLFCSFPPPSKMTHPFSGSAQSLLLCTLNEPNDLRPPLKIGRSGQFNLGHLYSSPFRFSSSPKRAGSDAAPASPGFLFRSYPLLRPRFSKHPCSQRSFILFQVQIFPFILP